MKRLILLTVFTSFLTVLAVAATPQLLGGQNQVHAATPSSTISNPACQKINDAGANVAGCKDEVDLQVEKGDTPSYLTSLTNAFIYIGGLISVVFLVIGGVSYITSTGDSSRVESAKKTITYAITGLIVVALARVIIGFVIGTLG